MQILKPPTSGTLLDRYSRPTYPDYSYFLILHLLLHMEICSWNFTMAAGD